MKNNLTLAVFMSGLDQKSIAGLLFEDYILLMF